MQDFFEHSIPLPFSQELGYAHNRLWRDSEHRSETIFAAMLEAPEARFVLLCGDQVLLNQSESCLSVLFDKDQAIKLGADMATAILLGTDPALSQVPIIAIPLCEEKLAECEQSTLCTVLSLRAAGNASALPADQIGILAQARSLLHWHQTHQFCGHCGQPTKRTLAGARRDCTACGALHFPRTDPAVIMLALSQNEEGQECCLLGHNTRFNSFMYSTLAGFVEPGETIEAAVRREILEEAGIRIGHVRYAASQPWPFPHTLMIGCYAQALSREICLDKTELSDAQWFTRAQIREMMARPKDTELSRISDPFSIAFHLIRNWVDAE